MTALYQQNLSLSCSGREHACAAPKQGKQITTLVSRGFVLPAHPPIVGHKRLDAGGGWHALALRKVIRDFLRPDLADEPVRVVQYFHRDHRIINAAAEADGAGTGMSLLMSQPRTQRGLRRIAEWIGMDAALIWPQHFARTGDADDAFSAQVSVRFVPAPADAATDAELDALLDELCRVTKRVLRHAITSLRNDAEGQQ